MAWPRALCAETSSSPSTTNSTRLGGIQSPEVLEHEAPLLGGETRQLFPRRIAQPRTRSRSAGLEQRGKVHTVAGRGAAGALRFLVGLATGQRAAGIEQAAVETLLALDRLLVQPPRLQLVRQLARLLRERAGGGAPGFRLQPLELLGERAPPPSGAARSRAPPRAAATRARASRPLRGSGAPPLLSPPRPRPVATASWDCRRRGAVIRPPVARAPPAPPSPRAPDRGRPAFPDATPLRASRAGPAARRAAPRAAAPLPLRLVAPLPRRSVRRTRWRAASQPVPGARPVAAPRASRSPASVRGPSPPVRCRAPANRRALRARARARRPRCPGGARPSRSTRPGAVSDPPHRRRARQAPLRSPPGGTAPGSARAPP